MERMAEGDEKAFYHLYESFRPQLRSFAIELTGSESEADDVLQETFIKIWLNRGKLPELDNPRAWVYTINARVCLNWLRRRVLAEKKMGELPIPDIEELTPFDAAHLNQLQQHINQVVAHMPLQRRKIFSMSRYEGKKTEEIADLLGISGGTVRNIIVSALKDIRAGLREAGYHLDVITLVTLLELYTLQR